MVIITNTMSGPEVPPLQPIVRKVVLVTDATKHCFVQTSIQYRLLHAIARPTVAFRRGLTAVVPAVSLHLFDAEELQSEISGHGLDDATGEERERILADWREHTEYTGLIHTGPGGHESAKWLWELLEDQGDDRGEERGEERGDAGTSGEPEQKEKEGEAVASVGVAGAVVGLAARITAGRLLYFTTGSSRAPPGGFKTLKPCQFKVDTLPDKSKEALPCAHTCTNALQLPIYESKQQLAERLSYALSEGGVGFGLA